MTHVVRDLDRVNSKAHKKEVLEAVTILEVPALWVVGLVGYVRTPTGLRALTTVWGHHLDDSFRRRFYKRWAKSKKAAFKRAQKRWVQTDQTFKAEVARIRKYCDVVRAIVHTDMKNLPLRQKKAFVGELQINGGNTSEKVDYVLSFLEKQVTFDSVFGENEMCDLIGITKGKGFQGNVKRWGVATLPRKTHRGLRKVACVGAWHPPAIATTIPRAGQMGYHHRVERNKKIYKIGKGGDNANATTPFDITKKTINPMGGFPHYGQVKNDYVMIKGTIVGTKKRLITIRKSMRPITTRPALEKIVLKFIDTSAKFGRGRFQTQPEKSKFMGTLKSGLYMEPVVGIATGYKEPTGAEKVEGEEKGKKPKK